MGFNSVFKGLSTNRGAELVPIKLRQLLQIVLVEYTAYTDTGLPQTSHCLTLQSTSDWVYELKANLYSSAKHNDALLFSNDYMFRPNILSKCHYKNFKIWYNTVKR